MSKQVSVFNTTVSQRCIIDNNVIDIVRVSLSLSLISSGNSKLTRQRFKKREGHGELSLSGRAASLASDFLSGARVYISTLRSAPLREAASDQQEVRRRRAAKTRRALPHDGITCESAARRCSNGGSRGRAHRDASFSLRPFVPYTSWTEIVPAVPFAPLPSSPR